MCERVLYKLLNHYYYELQPLQLRVFGSLHRLRSRSPQSLFHVGGHKALMKSVLPNAQFTLSLTALALPNAQFTLSLTCDFAASYAIQLGKTLLVSICFKNCFACATDPMAHADSGRRHCWEMVTYGSYEAPRRRAARTTVVWLT